MLVLIAAIALLWEGNQGCVNHLSSRGFKPLFSKISVKLLEEFFDKPYLAKPLSKKCDSRGIWDVIHHAKVEELLNRTSVNNGELEFLVAEIDKLIPDARFIQDKNNAALVQALIHGKIDVLLMAAEKASSWTVLYPQLRIVVPQPVWQVPKTRLFPRDAQTFLRTWENWIDFQITTGTKQTVFDHWVEGINKS